MSDTSTQLSKFGIEDKVVFEKVVGVVTGVGREVKWPGKAPTRKVWFVQPGKPETWAWDFQLEAW